MNGSPKNYFFLFYLKKPTQEEASYEVKFSSTNNNNTVPKCIYTIEENGNIIKVFKYCENIKKQYIVYSMGFRRKRTKYNIIYQ